MSPNKKIKPTFGPELFDGKQTSLVYHPIVLL